MDTGKTDSDHNANTYIARSSLVQIGKNTDVNFEVPPSKVAFSWKLAYSVRITSGLPNLCCTKRRVRWTQWQVRILLTTRVRTTAVEKTNSTTVLDETPNRDEASDVRPWSRSPLCCMQDYQIHVWFETVGNLNVHMFLGKMFIELCTWGLFCMERKPFPLNLRSLAKRLAAQRSRQRLKILSDIPPVKENITIAVICVAKPVTILADTEDTVTVTTFRSGVMTIEMPIGLRIR